MLKNNLAVTVSDSRRADRIITTRMLMDGMSAAIYLLTFRFAYFKAVVRAHKDYRRLVRKQGAKPAQAVDGHRIKGIYDKWIIPSAILRGTKAIAMAEKRMNHNISPSD